MYWLLFLIPYVLLLTSSPCAAGENFPNLIPNPSFEEDHDGDSVPDYWQINEFEEGILKLESQGHHGQKSISISGKGIWQCKIRNIKPHTYYLFSLWVKRDGFMDGEYPKIRLFEKELYLNELFSWGGWMRLSWFFNSQGHKETNLLLISPGMTHKIWFDDLYLTEFMIKPVSPSEGEIIEGTSPKLTWEIPEHDHILDIEIELSKDRNFKEKIVLQTVSPLGNSYHINRELAKGQWYWRMEVFKNRERIAISSPQMFIVVKSFDYPVPNSKNPTNSISAINPENLNSFFPIGIYGAPIEAFSELKRAGFNSVQSYARDLEYIQRFISSAEKSGLKALICIPKEAWEKDISPFFEHIKNSRSVLAWYLADEPEGTSVPPSYLWKLRNYVRSRDPHHPSALALVRSKRAWDYGPAVDILMVDTYPVPKMPVTWLSESIDEASRAVFHEKPVWAVVQAFDWSAYPYQGDKREWGRNPTYEEERCLTYLSIIHGARGIFYYTFKGGNYYIKDHPEHWEEVKRLVQELNHIYPLLLAPHNSADGLATENSNIHYGLKVVDKELSSGIIEEGSYLIAVNVANKPVRATFTLPSFFNNKARVLFEERSIPIEKGTLSDRFRPYDVHIYLLQ